MSEDELAELDELRRRAYGPDADIADDPAARTRLAELEAASRREHPGATLDLPPVEAAHPRVAGGRNGAGHRASDRSVADFGVGGAAPIAPDAQVPTRGGRGSIWAVAVSVTAVAVVIAVALWPRPVATPAASPTSSAVDVTCGSGWGPQAVGAMRPPRKAEVVWSPLWNATSDNGPTTVLFTEDGQWLGALTPVFVPGGVASVVQVIGPASARIVTFRDSRPSGGSLTSSDYSDTGAMVASGRRIVPLPPCGDPDVYPLLIIAPNDACVQLEVTLAGGPVYRASVVVGGGDCPRS